MMPTPCPAINLRVERVSALFRNRSVLREASFSARSGELWAVLGANGGGKSTLAAIAAGVASPSQGEVSLDDRPLARLTPRERAKILGFLPQYPELPPGLTVAEVVALGRTPHRGPFTGPGDEDRRAVDAALRRFGLESFAERDPARLSGGERQRVHLARLWVQDARVWVLDEPAAHLDLPTQLALLRDLREEADAGRSIVVVGHDLWFLPALASHVLLLRQGEVIAAGPREQVWTAELAERTFGIAFEADGHHPGRLLPRSP